jgi:hypothetical protein
MVKIRILADFVRIVLVVLEKLMREPGELYPTRLKKCVCHEVASYN